MGQFIKILYLTDLEQELLSLCRDIHLCAHLAISGAEIAISGEEIAISVHIQLSLRRDNYLCIDLAISVQR